LFPLEIDLAATVLPTLPVLKTFLLTVRPDGVKFGRLGDIFWRWAPFFTAKIPNNLVTIFL
jgi:hypothetical protein